MHVHCRGSSCLAWQLQGIEATALCSHGASTLEAYVQAVEQQCADMAKFVAQQRQLAALHQQRTAALRSDLGRFADILRDSLGKPETNYAAKDMEMPQRPSDDADLAGLCSYVYRMLDSLNFMVACGCTSSGVSRVESIHNTLHKVSRLGAELHCTVDVPTIKFAIACLFAIVDQRPAPIDAMLARATAAANDAETWSKGELAGLMEYPGELPQEHRERFPALEESFDEEHAVDLSGFARLWIEPEALGAFDGESVQGLVCLLGRLEQAHAAVRTALAQARVACSLDVHCGREALTYAQLHGAFLEAAKALTSQENEHWVETACHTSNTRQAARRTMLLCQKAFEPDSMSPVCDEPEPFGFLVEKLPKCRSHTHVGAVCDAMTRYSCACVFLVHSCAHEECFCVLRTRACTASMCVALLCIMC